MKKILALVMIVSLLGAFMLGCKSSDDSGGAATGGAATGGAATGGAGTGK